MASTRVTALSSLPARQARWPRAPGIRVFGVAAVMSGILYLAAAEVQRYGANRPFAVALGTVLLDVKQHNLGEWAAAGLCIAAAFLLRRHRFGPMLRAERSIAAFASHRIQAILF